MRHIRQSQGGEHMKTRHGTSKKTGRPDTNHDDKIIQSTVFQYNGSDMVTSKLVLRFILTY